MTNKVAKQSPKFTNLSSKWQKCRDVVAGGEAVKARGEAYLPRLTGQTNHEYNAYKERPPFFNATGRTVDVLSSLPFRKPISLLTESKDIEQLKDNIDGLGTSIQGLCEDITDEIMIVGLAGALVDMPSIESQHLSKAEEESYKPKIIIYKAEQILDCRTVVAITGKTIISQVRLKEEIEIEIEEFEYKHITQIRVLDLHDGQYRVRVFKENENKEWSVDSEVYPLKDSKTLDFIPFHLFTPNDAGRIEEPPIYDLVELNLGHYRLRASLYNGLHFLGIPTPYLTGSNIELPQDEQGKPEKLYVGGSQVWVVEGQDIKTGYLEFTGQGLSSLDNEIKEIKGEMAAQGARILAPEKKAAETAEATEIKHNGENSLLASYIQGINKGMTKLLRWCADWKSYGFNDIEVKISTDFLPTKIDAALIKELSALVMAGQLSQYSFFQSLIEGELISGTPEDEKNRINEEGPPLGGLTEEANVKE